MKTIPALLVLLISALFVGCGYLENKAANVSNTVNKTETNKTENAKTENTKTENVKTENVKTEPESAGDDNKLATPQGSIEYQFELIKVGDYDKLKECLTDRVKGDLTKEIVDKAKTDASKYTMDDLFSSSEEGEMDGKKTAKVKMKNGRTLTTLVETDGKWLSDTIWYKNN